MTGSHRTARPLSSTLRAVALLGTAALLTLALTIAVGATHAWLATTFTNAGNSIEITASGGGQPVGDDSPATDEAPASPAPAPSAPAPDATAPDASAPEATAPDIDPSNNEGADSDQQPSPDHDAEADGAKQG